MSIRIVKVDSKILMNEFIRLPYSINKNLENWIAPLQVSQREIFGKENPFWNKNTHCFFLAYSNQKCVGRIAAFINKEDQKPSGAISGHFGFLLATENHQVFEQLLNSSEKFLFEKGCEAIIGPLNPSIHFELGILTKGFEYPPYYMLSHNYEYYNDYLLKNGYIKLKDFYSYRLHTDKFICSERMYRISNLIKNKYNLSIRNPDFKVFKKELILFYNLYNNAFYNHWGFSPISWEEFLFLTKDMKDILDPKMILILEKESEPVAFLLSMPNVNEIFQKIKNGNLFPTGLIKLLYYKNKIKSLRVITVAVKKEWQHLGLGSLLYLEIAQRATQAGYTDSELSWVHEDNHQMNKICREVGGINYKEYRIYRKQIIPSQNEAITSTSVFK